MEHYSRNLLLSKPFFKNFIETSSLKKILKLKQDSLAVFTKGAFIKQVHHLDPLKSYLRRTI